MTPSRGGIGSKSAADAARLREAYVDRLVDAGVVRQSRVEFALRRIPLHLFLPGLPAEQVYNTTGVAEVALSADTVAATLELANVQPDDRILEIGTDLGYQAGLLAHIVGDNGDVTSIDADLTVVEDARNRLATIGHPQVRVIHTDPTRGYPVCGPYDVVISTIGSSTIPQAWLEQVAPDRTLIAPVRLRGSVWRALVLHPGEMAWRAHRSLPIPAPPVVLLDEQASSVPLVADGSVCAEVYPEQYATTTALADVLHQPGTQVWTGITHPAAIPFDDLHLWLSAKLAFGLSRLYFTRDAVRAGLVFPPAGHGPVMAAVNGPTMAYLTARPVDHPDPTRVNPRVELGVIGHGDGHRWLIDLITGLIHDWHISGRTGRPEFVLQPDGSDRHVSAAYTLHQPPQRLDVYWS